MSTRRGWLAVGIVALLAARVVAQAGSTPQEATAELTGDVVSEVQGTMEPVPRAVVRLENLETRARFSAVSDAGGQFSLATVPAGRYLLSAASPAYVTSYYGAQRVSQAGVPIVVTAGQPITGLRINLQRGGVISGTVRVESGRAARGAAVRFHRSGGLAAQMVVSSPGFTITDTGGTFGGATDGDGRFRLFGLPPGRYVVAAVGRPGTSEAMYAAPVYVPGTLFPQDAVPVDLGPGEVIEGLDITLRRAAGQRVSGQVIGPGAPGAEVRIDPVGPIRAVRSAREEGRFSFTDVPPGRYVLRARAVVAGFDGHEHYAGETPIVVGASEMRDVQIVMASAAGVRVSGRLDRVEGPGASAWPRARVVLRLETPWQSHHPIEAVVNEDGTFVAEAVPSGRYNVEMVFESATSEASPWRLVSFMVGTEDALDGGLVVDAGGIDEAVATVTQSRQQLRGVLRGSSTLPPTMLTMLVYPVERRFWTPRSRRIQTTRPATDGSFVFEDLPPGDYFAITLFDPDPAALFDPVYLASLVDVSLPVRLEPGERKVLEIATAP